jgi:hypothetical protein
VASALAASPEAAAWTLVDALAQGETASIRRSAGCGSHCGTRTGASLEANDLGGHRSTAAFGYDQMPLVVESRDFLAITTFMARARTLGSVYLGSTSRSPRRAPASGTARGFPRLRCLARHLWNVAALTPICLHIRMPNLGRQRNPARIVVQPSDSAFDEWPIAKAPDPLDTDQGLGCKAVRGRGISAPWAPAFP